MTVRAGKVRILEARCPCSDPVCVPCDWTKAGLLCHSLTQEFVNML